LHLVEGRREEIDGSPARDDRRADVVTAPRQVEKSTISPSGDTSVGNPRAEARASSGSSTPLPLTFVLSIALAPARLGARLVANNTCRPSAESAMFRDLVE
jgi:hypothetical protein